MMFFKSGKISGSPTKDYWAWDQIPTPFLYQITVDVFLLDGEAKVGTQTFENIVGVGGSQFLAEKVLNIMLDVKGIDFLHFCDAMVILCVDQEIRGIIVISLDGSVSQSPKLTVQFELF